MQDKEELARVKEAQARWEQGTLARALARSPETVGEFAPPPTIPTKRVYTPLDVADHNYEQQLGFPGEYPYTRGGQPTMYRGRLWTMRQYAGFGTAEETNQRYKALLEQGMMGINVAFDLPTQLGYDSDHPRAVGEVGTVGIACPSLREMETVFDGIPLDQVTPAMAINAPAQVLLSQYIAVGEKQGVSPDRLGGSTQNDILKEFIARGNFIYPPRQSVRLTVDLFEYCSKYVPKWNYINICGIHFREAGATLVQELAFAFGDAITYVETALERGMQIDDFAPRLAFNFAASVRFLEEAAKLRAARRLWARMMRERFGAKNAASWIFRTGTGSPGSTLTAQQPDNNIVRVTLHTIASALGGVQSLHTAAMDEALALPTEKSATLALRTQQVVAYESGLAEVIDPLAGSYYVESLTDQIEEEVEKYLDRIQSLGGMLRAIETGFVHREIADSSYQYQREVERGERVVVGVNRFTSNDRPAIRLHRPDHKVVRDLKGRLTRLRAERDNAAVGRALAELKGAAEGTENLMPYTLQAVKAYATVGEICDTLRSVLGEYRPPSFS